jgi:hypothetical protein
MMTFQSILDAAIGLPGTNPSFLALKGLHDLHPTAQHVPVLVYDEDVFPLAAYLSSRGIELSISAWATSEGNGTVTEDLGADVASLGGRARDSFTLYEYEAKKREAYPVLRNGKMSFMHDGVTFTAYKATWRDQLEQDVAYTFHDLIFTDADDGPGRTLASAVYAFGATLRDEIWVYQGGCWKANKDLYVAVQAAEWDDVVLPTGFKEGLRRDVGSFFECKDVYDELGITWKRGILLLGPPGNGKTESIKALLKDCSYPALYVKSFTTQNVSLRCSRCGQWCAYAVIGPRVGRPEYLQARP